MATSRSKLNEQIHFEINLFETLLTEKPHYTDALIALADLYTKVGEIKKGLLLDERLATLCPEDDTIFYNLACSYSLTGQLKKAYIAVKKAVKLGYEDFEHLAHDSDLEPLRKSKLYGPKLLLLLPPEN
ncbi:MAG: hypothetical protein HZC17_06245 [Candidatus Omnitrophica bacterium]|nr:hypothetical protein [Candidatus Omnitrophota bacterium]